MSQCCIHCRAVVVGLLIESPTQQRWNCTGLVPTEDLRLEQSHYEELGPYSRTTYEFLSAIFSQIWRRNCRKLRFFVNAILETVKIRIIVNIASKFRKLRMFVNAILETVKIRKFVNMAYFSP